MVSGFLSCFELKSALAELRSATGSLETVLLTLFHSRVTSQESCALKDRSVISVSLKECPRDTVADCSCLSCVTAAFYIYKYVELICRACRNKRLAYDNFQSLKSEILVDVSFIDRDLARSRYKVYSCN